MSFHLQFAAEHFVALRTIDVRDARQVLDTRKDKEGQLRLLRHQFVFILMYHFMINDRKDGQTENSGRPTDTDRHRQKDKEKENDRERQTEEGTNKTNSHLFFDVPFQPDRALVVAAGTDRNKPTVRQTDGQTKLIPTFSLMCRFMTNSTGLL